MGSYFYRTEDGLAIYQFSFEPRKETYRAYILDMPSYAERAQDLHITHRSKDETGRYYIAWSGAIYNEEDLKTIAALWSERTQIYIRTGITIDEQSQARKREDSIPAGTFHGWPEFLAIAASIASITQVVLMVTDMWLRKKQSNAKKRAKDKGKSWGEVREIRVLMSDGSLVQLDSWLANPSRVKEFLAIFHYPSKSPQPVSVVFILMNGSKVQLDVSNGPSDAMLDQFINILKP